ncbi:hypothetical protein EBB79_23395 (plasmid) [Parasedimentitalea marina]|uniref:Uncharacterized protein n=1 Tax=Parasedimentitalea marina TaxID=2483033 RepID=A0A3T0NA41_9RHOB|nr:hypothetical protein EBB79_23395 [Parasedimentitalea marina]
MSTWVTEQLADWAIELRPDQLPADVLDKAGDCILDAIACAIAKQADGWSKSRAGSCPKYFWTGVGQSVVQRPADASHRGRFCQRSCRFMP